MSPLISIVDDDTSARSSVDFLVQSLGYLTASFASAEEFLKSDCLRDTACLITDIRMPGMSGLELQDQIALSGHEIPVIFITAFSEVKLRDRALKAGALGFLNKPFREETLIACLEKALGSTSLQ
jgi:FixJ family two-component response regulator